MNSSVTPQFHQDHHSLDPHHHQHPLPLAVPSRQQAFWKVAGYLSFLKGKKLVVLSLDGPLAAWILELHDNSIKSSFSASMVALR